MLPTFTGFSHGLNQSAEAKKASPALFPFVLLNFEAKAKCNQLQRRPDHRFGRDFSWANRL
jgi:hypothetical protein